MSAVAMGESSRGQKPAVAPRRQRRMLRYTSAPEESAAQQQRTKTIQSQASRSTSDLLAAPAKTKPARPDPPKMKFRPEVPPPPSSLNKKPEVKMIAARRPSPPSEPASRELLQSALSQYYGIGNNNSFNTTPSRTRRKKSNGEAGQRNVINADKTDRGTTSSVYLNVAPKAPPARHVSKGQVTRDTKGSPLATKKVTEKTGAPVKKLQITDSRETVLHQQKSQTPASAKLPSRPHHLSPAQKQQLFACNSVPLPDQLQVGSSLVAVHHSRGASIGQVRASPRQGKVVPVRPAPPRPYSQKKKTCSENVDKEIKIVPSEVIEEYTYVDPQRCRYPRNLDALDLSTRAGGYVETSNNTSPVSVSGSDVYTALSMSTITEDVYTVPDPPSKFALPMVSDVPPHGREVGRFTDMESTGRAQEHPEGHHSVRLYANVAPKAPVSRSKSFTLNTSSGPDSPSPTSLCPSHDDGSPPHYERFSPEETDGSMYMTISHDTREPPSIYEVPPPSK